ncbi:dynactin p62 family-domain-containing protein [Limtongia smithiae]|uniref:dynactin p62 family-domain-containing protein n=1 Tax=Limtongia smithiae TaxID=1125753 RepID=UPI0034CD1420
MGLPFLRIHCPCAEPIINESPTTTPSSSPARTQHSSVSPSPLPGIPPLPAADRELPPSLWSPSALHALNNLYFCDTCMAVRCERCVIEEVVQVYCPSCFHVYHADTGSTGEGTRGSRGGRVDDASFCTRNCLTCPLCVANLVMYSTETSTFNAEPTLYLQCPHCLWDSRQTGSSGVYFSKTSSLYHQLRNLARTTDEVRPDEGSGVLDPKPSLKPLKEGEDNTESHETKFEGVLALYKHIYEVADAEAAQGQSTKLPLWKSSRLRPPSSTTTKHDTELTKYAITPTNLLGVLARESGVPEHKSRAYEESQAERYIDILDTDAEERELKRAQVLTSLDKTLSFEQQHANPFSAHRTTEYLLPAPTRLRTRRAKRCRACRHILVRPDLSTRNPPTSSTTSASAAVSTNFRVNLLSKNYIPTIRITHIPSLSLMNMPYTTGFVPHITYKFALTLFNPLYEPIKVTLATPPRTPAGKHAVTILAPRFPIGGNVEDDWDLQAILDLRTRLKSIKSTSTTPSSSTDSTPPSTIPNTNGVFGRGRNWTSVLCELLISAAPRDSEIQIPLFVSVAYEVEVEREFDVSTSSTDAAAQTPPATDKEQRETAFWAVLNVGKVGGIVDKQ